MFEETNIWEVVRNATIRSRSDFDHFVANYKASLYIRVPEHVFKEIQAMQPHRGEPYLEEQWFKKTAW